MIACIGVYFDVGGSAVTFRISPTAGVILGGVSFDE